MPQDKLIPGFHGDKYLLSVIDALVTQVDFFIETGTNIGITLNYVARTYPEVCCLSCEPNTTAFLAARNRILDCTNASVFRETSQHFLERLQRIGKSLFEKAALFWLDAHGHGFEWPLREEVAFITKNFKQGFILIDDFKVPNKKRFKFNAYKKQQCSFDFIKSAIHADFKFNLYYPKYTEHTSPFHPLVGWGLLQFGSATRLDEILFEEIEWAKH
jgi:hypothetical protein